MIGRREKHPFVTFEFGFRLEGRREWNVRGLRISM